MFLYLMRHGEASPAQNDLERGLTKKGYAKIENFATQMVQNKMHFSHVYHSHKKRAKQTAEIMIQHISPELIATKHNSLNPNDDPNIIEMEINTWSENTLIVGHLPFIPALLTELTQQPAHSHSISFGPGTLVCLKKNKDTTWSINWHNKP